MARRITGLPNGQRLAVPDLAGTLDDELARAVAHWRSGGTQTAGTWAWTTAWALVWSRGALDSMTDASPARHFLKGMAREAGMPGYTLKLTKEAAAKAYADQYEAGRRRRRAVND